MMDKIKKIKVVAMDVDGVMTDGKIIVDSQGEEIKNFDVQDGYGIALLRRAGLRTAIITARASVPVKARAEDLKIDKLYDDAYPKITFYEAMLKDFSVSDDEVCFIGDDLPDLPLLKRVGFSVAVFNAAEELKEQADYITKKTGGSGAVREVIKLILETQDKWQKVIDS